MSQRNPAENGYQSRTRRNTRRLVYWNGGWAAATLLMSFGPRLVWSKAVAFTVLSVCLDFALGVGMVLATKKYVMELDELQQKVYLNALGIAVGVGLITGVPLSVLDAYRVLPIHVNFGLLVILMGLTFLVSFLYGALRYR